MFLKPFPNFCQRNHEDWPLCGHLSQTCEQYTDSDPIVVLSVDARAYIPFALLANLQASCEECSHGTLDHEGQIILDRK